MKTKVNEKSWHTEEMPAKNKTIILKRNLSKKDISTLSKGHIPEAMEDKWFYYAKDSKLYIHRSWTGNCIYILALKENTDLNVVVNRNEKEYSNVDDNKDIDNINFLLDSWLSNTSYYDIFLKEFSDNLKRQKKKK